MSFNSLHFLIFFPIVIGLYFSIPHRYRWMLLLIASYYFYMSWKAEYIMLIALSTLVNYSASLWIDASPSQEKRKWILGLTLVFNLGLLFAFKYFNFFSDSLRALLQQFSIPMNPVTLKILLPVGISFYTFQAISYIIDVYRETIKPERHLGIFALYISFFPQLVAGPIERAKNFLPQFFEQHHFDYKRVTDGLKLMMWGFFKKIVIADRLAAIVNIVYNNPADHAGFSLVLATIFFGFQIYCDFSGYCDIGIGSAEVMGFRLMDNFKRPYLSRSVFEFWKKWHISLSSWFRDYLYIPLGGSRVSVPRWYANVLIVFLASGLWHGANWTFVAWGALHGMYLVFAIILKPLKDSLFRITDLAAFPKIARFLEIAMTFILVNIAWIFFRANSIEEAFYIVTHLLSNFDFTIAGVNPIDLWIAVIVIAFMLLVHGIQEHRSMRQFLDTKPVVFRWSLYLITLYMLLLSVSASPKEFIYFQF